MSKHRDPKISAQREKEVRSLIEQYKEKGGQVTVLPPDPRLWNYYHKSSSEVWDLTPSEPENKK